jgi:hypothetical protein
MTPREATKVGLIFTGVVLLTCGLAVACSSPRRADDPILQGNTGAWKALNVPNGVPKHLAPYLAVSGIAAMLIGWRLREP